MSDEDEFEIFTVGKNGWRDGFDLIMVEFDFEKVVKSFELIFSQRSEHIMTERQIFDVFQKS